jgi:peptidoglycan-associated lipoprotein
MTTVRVFELRRAMRAPQWALLASLGLATGCGGASVADESTLPSAARGPADDGSSTAGRVPTQSAQGCGLEPVHFAYDSSELDHDARDVLSNDARCLRDRGMPQVTVTGMTDPRGTEEYNLALGERRARSTTRYLQGLGVAPEKLRASSTGEEMASDDESGWAHDRRAELRAP